MAIDPRGDETTFYAVAANGYQMTDGAGPPSLWETNVPYLLIGGALTVINYLETAVVMVLGLKDLAAAILIVGILVSVSLTILGYDRDFLAEAVFGR